MLDLAIIGAPRAGTSTLFAWLNAHPAVQGSTPKETYFFMDAEHPLTVRQEKRGEPTAHTAGLSAFDTFFDESADGLRLEATTHHYYQDTAQEMFARSEPKPHVLFVVRQPAHRIRSSFLFTKHNRGRIDPGLTFNRYVDVLLNGDPSVLSQHYHSDSSLYIAKRELELSTYVVWLERWEERLGTEHVHPLVFERFVEESRRVVVQICRTLGIDPSFYEKRSVSAKGETTLVRSPTLQRLAHEVGTRIPDGRLKQAVKSLYRWIQVQDASASDASGTDRGVEQLKEYFEPRNERLAQHSNLDLSSWCRP